MTQFALSIIFSVRYRLFRYAPTNILLIRAHGRRGVRWFLLAVGLVAVYFYAAAICVTVLNQDGAGWLNPLVILLVWNGFKMLRIDPVTLVPRRYIRITPRPSPRRIQAESAPHNTRNNSVPLPNGREVRRRSASAPPRLCR